MIASLAVTWALFAAPTTNLELPGFLTDPAEAVAQAQAEGKLIFAFFTKHG